MVHKFFDNKIRRQWYESMSNQQLVNELYTSIIRTSKRRKVYSSFKDNIWSANLADMQSIGKRNKGIRFLLCAINIFSKYALVVPLKDKKGKTIVNAVQKYLSISCSSKRKPGKLWVD